MVILAAEPSTWIGLWLTTAMVLLFPEATGVYRHAVWRKSWVKRHLVDRCPYCERGDCTE